MTPKAARSTRAGLRWCIVLLILTSIVCLGLQPATSLPYAYGTQAAGQDGEADTGRDQDSGDESDNEGEESETEELPGNAEEVQPNPDGQSPENAGDADTGQSTGRQPENVAGTVSQDVVIEAPNPITDEETDDLTTIDDTSADSTPVYPNNYIDDSQLPDSSFIYDVAIVDLANADAYYNGQTVQVTGEAVGDRIVAGPDSNWITLMAKDGTYAEITVHMSRQAANLIDTFGAYEKVGTTVQVQGVYQLVCPDHDGLSDLHADKVNIIRPGYSTHVPFDVNNFIVGFVIVGLALLVMFVFQRLRERLR